MPEFFLPLLALVAAGPQVQPPAVVARLPACTADQLSIALDGEGGAFDGMSHSGALLVVRNVGPAACRVEGLPALSFRDASGAVLDVGRRPPIGMHPGPVILPVGLAPGAEATSALRWVSGDAWGGGRCRRVASARLAIGGQSLAVAFAATICSPAGRPAQVEQPVLRVDPVL